MNILSCSENENISIQYNFQGSIQLLVYANLNKIKKSLDDKSL